jgi:hypothetical protein
MTLIAINILLDPDAATVEKAQATNARLRETYPDGFALDANHAPLQQRIIDAVAPFAVEQGTGEAFAPRLDGQAIGQPTVDYVNNFVGPRTGTNYQPHLTVGIGTGSFVDALKAEPFEPFTVRAVSVSLYQLGDYGVAQRKLYELHRC